MLLIPLFALLIPITHATESSDSSGTPQALFMSVTENRALHETAGWTGRTRGRFEKTQHYGDGTQLDGGGEFEAHFQPHGCCFSFAFRVNQGVIKKTFQIGTDER